eukprot:CAMPEP_0196707704 /NCGR_PEP_ID=MMETSP1090-20130531/64603_1 /TAXON_ID=37098 /ORGANISM="Isochrysis sp, Strain CCMP1244" /LENGTH=97 /DNA_ID=CAMNT_0042047685 /DNA_START=396 /DNA_END=689 /DNA_ORIENTATION=+
MSASDTTVKSCGCASASGAASGSSVGITANPFRLTFSSIVAARTKQRAQDRRSRNPANKGALRRSNEAASDGPWGCGGGSKVSGTGADAGAGANAGG